MCFRLNQDCLNLPTVGGLGERGVSVPAFAEKASAGEKCGCEVEKAI